MRISRSVAVVAAGLALVLAGAAPSAARPERPTSNVTAYGQRGLALPPNPPLHRGDTVRVVARGFAGDAVVRVRVVEGTAAVATRADALGVVRLPFAVPAAAATGQHRMSLTGQGPSTGDDGGRPGNVAVAVPAVGLLPYRVVGAGFGVAGVSDGHASAGAARRSLSATGADVLGPLMLAAAALFAGAAVLAAGRRRRNGRPS